MGQELSCLSSHEHDLFSAVQHGDTETVRTMVERDSSLLHQTTPYDRQSLLHIAAANGQIGILSMLLDQSLYPDLLNRRRQTPLMLAAMRGKIFCVKKLLFAGANVLKFDSLNGRTCLHYAAYHGHADCLQAILSSAKSSHVAASWGYARFVNVRDGRGATPLHLAARQRRPDCVHILLDSGALVCASTDEYGHPGSTPLHLAARGGSLDCVRELLAWGADRLQRDDSGRIPYSVAMTHMHKVCAALLDPSSTEPLVWPSPLKFISELNQDAKVLLERALMQANKERESRILEGKAISVSPSHSEAGEDSDILEANDSNLCTICFEQVCTIQVQNCSHQLCAHCTLSLCCHNKPNPNTASLTPPVCPFCRGPIARLTVAEFGRSNDPDHDVNDISSSKLRRTRRSRNLSEGSCSFRGLSSSVGSLGKHGGFGSGRIAVDDDLTEKP
ncbi:hypothetical protein SAY87_005283 [Trapa incisa]|uniref:RING-type E3 ubiquitin transferase n=1 Tax=Trapa incisa TaxID=236973 RepID=A0AAN7KC54_9MYRT|nr:hypothetical protein SAY87_005283 [Trapa incisa]